MRLAHPPQPDQEQTEAVIDRPTRICIWVILLGLANFLAYTLIYMFIGGEAVHGHVDQVGDQLHYYLQSGKQVSRGVYIYSGIHSTSIWLTVAAIMLAMLTLAKERIVSSMASSIVRGRTLITILATIITLVTVLITIYFIMTFLDRLWHPQVVLHAGS
ncbi:MAG: hypothetical protein ACLFUJ_04335 [Phycisphaerae bacterium]